MPQNRKAFVRIDNLQGDDYFTGHVSANGAEIRSPSEGGSGGAVGVGATVQIDYTDSSQTIHERLADAIRINREDPDLIVIFTDSPGRY